MGLPQSVPAKKKKPFPRTAEDKRLDAYTDAYVHDKPYKLERRTGFTVVDVSNGNREKTEAQST